MSIKLLMLNYEYPPLGGGAGVITQNITEGLLHLGYKVTVVTTWYAGENEITEYGNLTIIKLKSKRKYIYKSNPIEMLSWLKKAIIFCKGLCKRKKFDICFAHFALPGGAVAYYLKKKFAIPYVIMSHGHDIPWFYPRQMFFYHLICYFWIKKICKNSEFNFVQSIKMKKNIDSFTGSKLSFKNIIIPNGSNVRQFKPDTKAKSEKFKIIFVGRLVKQKDPFTFLKAIRIFSRTNFEFIVHIIGDGPLRKKMEKYVRKNNLQNKIIFKGWLSKEELIKEYQSANIKVSPSIEEGMSISVMESLACGQYILATPVSNNPLLIRENINGELIDIKDYRVLAEKIERFYLEKFTKGYTVPQEVIEDYQKKWDWLNIVKKYDEYLSKIKDKKTIN